jgi:hypothetical protein
LASDCFVRGPSGRKRASEIDMGGPLRVAAYSLGPRAARMLMTVAADERLQIGTGGSVLPGSWRTLYELSKLDDATLSAKIADRTIRPDIERAEVLALAKAARAAPERAAHAARVAEGCILADLNALADSGMRFGGIMADPGWKFLTQSDRGEGRSAGQHYTTTAFEEIKALPVKRLAAPNCALFL